MKNQLAVLWWILWQLKAARILTNSLRNLGVLGVSEVSFQLPDNAQLTGQQRLNRTKQMIFYHRRDDEYAEVAQRIE